MSVGLYYEDEIHTLSDIVPASLPSLVQFFKCIKSRQDLNGAHSIEHVGVMTRGSTEATILMLT